jgi:hypothetical protein
MFWPLAIVMLLLSLGAEYVLSATASAPPAAPKVTEQTQVEWLVRYCNAVHSALEASPTARAQAGSVPAPTAPGLQYGATYGNYETGSSGTPRYTLECWAPDPPPGGTQGEVIAAAAGDATVGLATSPTQWTSLVQGIPAQSLPHALTAAQQGTVVILKGY